MLIGFWLVTPEAIFGERCAFVFGFLEPLDPFDGCVVDSAARRTVLRECFSPGGRDAWFAAPFESLVFCWAMLAVAAARAPRCFLGLSGMVL